MKENSIFIIADENNSNAIDTKNMLLRKYSLCTNIENAKVIVALGGDGFMLHSMHNYMEYGLPFYGINCGSIGFLMNDIVNNILDAINNSVEAILHPLHMKAKGIDGSTYEKYAFNEVSLLRQTYQSAKIRVVVDNKTRIDSLSCDGILLATAAGSTAYNLSVRGSIIPLGMDMLALTPISPFRPRDWRGALLSSSSNVKFYILESDKRPVSVTADYNEIRDIMSVEIYQDTRREIKLLFNSHKSLQEKIIREQFYINN